MQTRAWKLGDPLSHEEAGAVIQALHADGMKFVNPLNLGWFAQGRPLRFDFEINKARGLAIDGQLSRRREDN